MKKLIRKTSLKEKRVKMASKVLKKMEVLRGFIQIPAKSRLELIGNIPLPCSTMLNGNPAKLDKYGRLWSSYLKNRFSIGTKVELSKTENGYQVTPSVSKQGFAVSKYYDYYRFTPNLREIWQLKDVITEQRRLL